MRARIANGSLMASEVRSTIFVPKLAAKEWDMEDIDGWPIPLVIISWPVDPAMGRYAKGIGFPLRIRKLKPNLSTMRRLLWSVRFC